MSEFIYFYAQFTEEFLLLDAAGFFILLSAYCYYWVIRRRRLGAAQDLIPSAVVKQYLNQLIHEAQFVRTQLFGILGNPEGDQSLADYENVFARRSATPHVAPAQGETSAISPDLMARLQALEGQLAEKEGLVMNINIEKTKLQEELEKAKNAGASVSGDQADLVKKIKALEERLEEYALFEDDLANLKRLQQENNQLKKRLESIAEPTSSPQKPIEPKSEPTIASVAPAAEGQSKLEPAKKEAPSLDQSAIDALLNGETPLPPASQPEPKMESMVQSPSPVAAPTDPFENLQPSINQSLDQTLQAAPAAEKNDPVPDTSIATKTDEELLKEFENLLNS